MGRILSACLLDVLQMPCLIYGCSPWTDGFTCWWVITTVSDLGGQMVTLTRSQTGGDFSGRQVVWWSDLLPAHSGFWGWRRHLCAKASTPGGGMVVCCFGKTTMTHFLAIFMIYVGIFHDIFSLRYLSAYFSYKTQHFHSWEWSTCTVL